MSFNALLEVRKPDQGLVQVVEAAGLLLDVRTTDEDHGPDAPVYRGVCRGSIYGPTLRLLARHSPSEILERLRLLDLTSVCDEVANEVFAKTLQASFAEEGNTRGSPGLAPPWASSAGEGGTFINRIAASQSYFADSLKNSFEGAGVTAATAPKSAEISTPATTWNHARAISEVDAAIHALKLAVVGVTRRLMDDVNRLPLRNRTTAVLVDGSRMSLLALELAGAAWKFGRFVVVHVSGEHMQSSNSGDDRPECEDTTERESQHKNDAQKEKESRGNDIETRVQRRGNGEGRWEPSFLQEELREMCLQQLEIPAESLEMVFRTLPPGSLGTVDEVIRAIDTVLTERGVEVVFMGCYGPRGPRVAQFGTVAHWALEHTPYQIVFAKKFSPSMVSPEFFTRPKRYVVAVTSDLDKVSGMLDKLLPLMCPRDSVVLLHIVDESVEDVIAGETEDVEELKSDLASLLSNKRGLSHRVRVEMTGRPPEQPTQTVVQRIVKTAEEEAADFLVVLYDESRGSYRTVATGCLRETRCGLVAIH